MADIDDTGSEDRQADRRREVTAALRALRDERHAAQVVLDRRARWGWALQFMLFVGLAAALYHGAVWYAHEAGARIAAAEADAMADDRPWALEPPVVPAAGSGFGVEIAGQAADGGGDPAVVLDRAEAAHPAEGSTEPSVVDVPADVEEPIVTTTTRRVRRTVAYSQPSTPRTRGGIRWLEGATEFQRADRNFREGSRPLLLYVYTDWCGGCASVERYLWGDGEVAGVVTAHYTPIRINPDDGPNESFIARSYRVRGYPTVLVKASPSAPLVRMQVMAGGYPVAPAALARALRDEAGRR